MKKYALRARKKNSIPHGMTINRILLFCVKKMRKKGLPTAGVI